MSSRLPGVISTVSVNPLLTAGITSVRKPIIFGVGDVKVLIENERLIKGAVDGSDSVLNTVHGSSIAYQLANVIRVGNAPNSADYEKTNDYTINGSGEIDWTSAVSEPTTGQEYYITYYKTLTNFGLTEYTSEGEIKSAHGDIVMSSTKQFATITAVASGSEDTNFSWGNEEAVDTPTDWTITFASGPNTNIVRSVTAYSTGEFTVSPAFPNVAAIGDIFLIENGTPIANTVTIGGLLSLRNGAQSTIVGQLDNSGFTNSIAPSGSEYSAALNTHLETLKSDIEMPYYLVPMLPDNSVTFATNSEAQSNAINPVWNHCKLMSAPENKGERTCVAGFLAATSVANFKSYGSSYFSQRAIIVAPGDLEFTEISGKTINGSLGAAALAGKVCSITRVSQSILNEALVGISVATNFYNSVQQRDLTSKGITFIISDAGVPKVIAGKTTDITSADTEDIAVVAVADYTKKVTREELANTFIGAPINSRLVGAMGGKMSSIFERLIQEQILDTYKDITVKQDATEPRLMQVTASIKPVYSLWWVSINMDFYV